MVLVSFYSYTNDFISAGSHIQMAGWASQFISKGDGGHMAGVLLESLQKLLQLGDNLCVHCFHKGLEALLPQDLLLGLELLIDELLQRHCVHRVLQGQHLFPLVLLCGWLFILCYFWHFMMTHQHTIFVRSCFWVFCHDIMKGLH